ncbi:MAG: hypothetical protein IPI67_06085 [Myxococcales bacterium]|nr:hypothetical protein [Myxococcales bacterium]
MTHQLRLAALVLLALPTSLAACGDDDNGGGGTEADKIGVGASCNVNEDCAVKGQTCLPFKGGYCGLADCTADADCPQGSACVSHDDGKNYCFRICLDKSECNYNRPVDLASNCSSNVTFVEGKKGNKACVPPS